MDENISRRLMIVGIMGMLSALFTVVMSAYGAAFSWIAHQNYLITNVVCMQERKKNYFLNKLKQKRLKRLHRKKRAYWVKPGRTDLCWQNMLHGRALDDCWRKNFRLSRKVFYDLLDQLRPHISPYPSPNTRALCAEKKLAVTLYYLKDTGSLNMTANTFGIAICTTSSVIFETCKIISQVLGPRYVFMPRNQEEMRRRVAEFEAKYGMIQAFGCVDGTHIPILRPAESSQDYYCYKGFFSLNAQAICDYRGHFMDVECRWPGSVHDAKVFANSSINKAMRLGKLAGTYQCDITGFKKIPNYLIGDPAYPLLPFCQKEYDTCQSNGQVLFNNLLRAARNPIECAFGRLKARWSILTRKIDLKIERVPTVVYACFVLHNFSEQHNCYVDEELVAQQITIARDSSRECQKISDPVYSYNNSEGEAIRSSLTEYIKMNLPDHLDN